MLTFSEIWEPWHSNLISKSTDTFGSSGISHKSLTKCTRSKPLHFAKHSFSIVRKNLGIYKRILELLTVPVDKTLWMWKLYTWWHGRPFHAAAWSGYFLPLIKTSSWDFYNVNILTARILEFSRLLWTSWRPLHTYDRGEPAVSYEWTGWIWEITNWWSSRLQENYRSFLRNL